MQSFDPSSIIYHPVTNIQEAYAIEILGYPPEEAATLEKLTFRQSQAPNLFIGAFVKQPTGEKLIGFVVSTQSQEPLVTEKAMSSHDASGETVCLHSVCVDPNFRDQKIATQLMNYYIGWVRQLKQSGQLQVKRIALMSRQRLSDWYSKLGFQYLGPSKVQHGDEKWNDHVLEL